MRYKLGLVYIGVLASLVAPVLAQEQSAAPEAAVPTLGFAPTATPGEFSFDTGALRGVLRQGGASIGLVPMEHVPTGIPLSKSPGILDHYRVFTTNHRYGESARSLPSESKLLPDGSLEVHWPSAEDRPYEITSTFRWRDAATADLQVEVQATMDLPDFEVFLASYCSERFPATSVYVKQAGDTGKPGFVIAEKESGPWQVFPRDAKASDIIKDGRWTIPPNPVDWAVMPEIAAPLAFRREPSTGIVAMVMAPPQESFAVFTPCRDDPHCSMYLALFGQTLKNGETARAHVRFAIAVNPTDDQVVTYYQDYLKEMGEKPKL
ncbi:MAG: hypothetical protein IT365_24215 [Candidatus Hydrogenedentes bacterium]|nr:hypothetical protein [Candidatus Hydrogenedentota bacterium]